MEKDIRATERYYEFQKKEWLASRVFWVFMSFVLFAAALGLFGKGLLSNKTYNQNNLRIEYNKFMRVEKGTELVIQVADSLTKGEVIFGNDYLKKVRIDQIIPEPESVTVLNNKLIYRFSTVQNGFITFYLIPTKMGAHQLHLTINERNISFDQFIYF
ncbi:hypothetical protein [Adhaeribacter aquaticus]|uniref:hypothetical protein n=1 Tax=Adhaeribacter aquaticus TaxID=299567 RepID=UPI00041403B3|nr:hypothetical protein [Adhaeribacter aquaticus]